MHPSDMIPDIITEGDIPLYLVIRFLFQYHITMKPIRWSGGMDYTRPIRPLLLSVEGNPP